MGVASQSSVQYPLGPLPFTFRVKKAKRHKVILWARDGLEILDRSAGIAEQRGEEKAVKQYAVSRCKAKV